MAPGTDLQFADLNGADPGADQLHHLTAYGFHHPPNLAVASFTDPDFDVRVLAGIAHSFYFGGACRAIAEFNPFSELFECVICEGACAFHQVGLGDFVIGIGEPLGELRVVGKDQKSTGIEIQTAYRGHEGIDIGDQIVDGGTAFRIFEGRDVTRRLVEQDVDGALRLERLVVEQDLVAVEIDPLVRIFDDASVNAYAPGVDPASGLGART
jgi:hypothetical protein